MWGNHPLSQRNKAKKGGGSKGFLGGGQNLKMVGLGSIGGSS